MGNLLRWVALVALAALAVVVGGVFEWLLIGAFACGVRCGVVFEWEWQAEKGPFGHVKRDPHFWFVVVVCRELERRGVLVSYVEPCTDPGRAIRSRRLGRCARGRAAGGAESTRGERMNALTMHAWSAADRPSRGVAAGSALAVAVRGPGVGEPWTGGRAAATGARIPRAREGERRSTCGSAPTEVGRCHWTCEECVIKRNWNPGRFGHVLDY